MPELTDADKIIRNDTGINIATKLNAIGSAIGDIGAKIDDNTISLTKVWSSSKVNDELSNIPVDIDDLSDVNIINPTDGQILTYDGTNEEWVNQAVPTPTVPTDLDDLSDVDLSNPADGQIIKYDATLGKWVNAAGGGGASYKILTDTLEAGHTSITFTDADILADSIISCATPAGINPTAMTSTTGSVTFYFQSQAADMVVKAVIF